jgi:hypothetical protein
MFITLIILIIFFAGVAFATACGLGYLTAAASGRGALSTSVNREARRILSNKSKMK